MDGFKTIVFKEKRRRIPVKREPVYKFLQRTLEKQDAEKQKAKGLTLQVVHDFFLSKKAKKIKVLSLPGVTWEWERLLRKRLGMYPKHRINVSVTGCEIDYRVFTLSSAKMPGSHKGCLNPYYSNRLGCYCVTNTKEQVYLLNTDVFDLIASPTHDPKQCYDVMWIDTTHTVVSISKKLPNINGFLSQDALLILTVLKGREHLKFETNRVDYISDVVAPFGLKLIHQMDYFDTCPMMHLIYKRENVNPQPNNTHQP